MNGEKVKELLDFYETTLSEAIYSAARKRLNVDFFQWQYNPEWDYVRVLYIVEDIYPYLEEVKLSFDEVARELNNIKEGEK